MCTTLDDHLIIPLIVKRRESARNAIKFTQPSQPALPGSDIPAVGYTEVTSLCYAARSCDVGQRIIRVTYHNDFTDICVLLSLLVQTNH